MQLLKLPVYKRFWLKLVCVFPIFCVLQASALEWKMPVGYSKNNLHAQLAFYFADQVKRESNGALTLQVISGGEMYKSDQIFGAVRRDLVPIGGRLLSGLVGEHPLLEIDAIPFLATSYVEAFKLYSAMKPELEKVMRVKGLKLLYAVPWPAQGLYASRELQDIDSFSGLRLRPYSKLTAEFADALGAERLIVDVRKVNRSLKKKEVDLLFGSAGVASRFRLGKALPYWYPLNAWLPKEVVVVNLQRWDALSAPLQLQVLAAARNTENEGWVRSKRSSEIDRAQLTRYGVKEIELSVELRSTLEKIGENMLATWLQRTGDLGRYVLERYQRSL